MAFDLDVTGSTDTDTGDLDLGSDTSDLGDGAEGLHESGAALDAGDSTDETDGLDVADEGEDQGTDDAASKAAANDGRTLPNDVKQALKAVQAANPTVAGKLRDAFFTNKAYAEVFATPAEATKARDFLDGIGGEDGFKGLQESLTEWSGVEKAFTDGSPDFVKRLIEASPEAFQKLAPNVINEWAQSAPEAFGYFRSSVALNAFATAGITTDALRTAYAQVADNPQAKVLIEDVFNALAGMQKTASQYKDQQSQRNPEREKLDADRKQFEDTKQTEFETDLSTKTDTYAKSKADPWLKQYIGTQQLPDGVKAAIDRDLIVEVGNRLMQVPGFDARLASLVKSRNGADALVAVQGQIDKIVQVATKTVVERYTRTAGQAVKPGATGKKPDAGKPGQNTGTGALTLNGSPDPSKVDFTKTSKSEYIAGRGVLKDGRRYIVK